MHKLNPNHPVAQMADDDFMHKIAAILVMRAGGKVTIKSEDLHALRASQGGEMPTLVTHVHKDSIDFVLMRESEAMELAREHGGLPI